MTKTTNFADEIKTVAADMQNKATLAARGAYAKGSEMFGEAGEFTKGNAEAMIESGKVLASGLKTMGETMVADTKESFEVMQAQAKALTTVKSPTDFVKLQGEFARANFDKAIGYGSKNTEAMLKLANDVFAPISGRVSLAVDKFRKAA